MARILISLLIGAFALGAAGCAARRAGAHGPKAQAAPGRSAAQIRAGFEAEKQRTPHLTMLSEEEAHKALPTMFKRGPMPTLARVGGLQPRTMEAVLGLARAMRQEGDLDEALLNDVFWAVSSANDCFY